MFKKFNGVLLLLLLAMTGCLPTAGGDTAVPTTPPPTDAPVTITAGPATDTPTPTVFPDTPAPMCTPPACQENEVYYCSGDCPGGCGTTCATVTPDPNTALPPVPDDWSPLAIWLAEAYDSAVNVTAVHAALQSAGWQRSDSDWLSADLTGEQQAEWVLLLTRPDASDALPAQTDLWIVGGGGPLTHFYDEPKQLDGLSLKLEITGAADLNGDGVSELVVNEETCGAHTCFTGLHVLNVTEDTVTNLVQTEANQPDAQAENVITVSYADIRFEDVTSDGILDLLVHGGSIGSVGAGIVRTYTEVWSWNGTAVTLADTILDPTEYRHHILYEANLRLEEGDLDEARRLYEATINDDTLTTPEFLTTPEETYAAISQFAAVRLILLDLWQGNTNSANGRLTWLQQNYPGTPMTEAAVTLVNNWNGQAELPALCSSIETTLVGSDNPTGALADLGYGNPSLQAEDFCPETMN